MTDEHPDAKEIRRAQDEAIVAHKREIVRQVLETDDGKE